MTVYVYCICHGFDPNSVFSLRKLQTVLGIYTHHVVCLHTHTSFCLRSSAAAIAPPAAAAAPMATDDVTERGGGRVGGMEVVVLDVEDGGCGNWPALYMYINMYICMCVHVCSYNVNFSDLHV